MNLADLSADQRYRLDLAAETVSRAATRYREAAKTFDLAASEGAPEGTSDTAASKLTQRGQDLELACRALLAAWPSAVPTGAPDPPRSLPADPYEAAAARYTRATRDYLEAKSSSGRIVRDAAREYEAAQEDLSRYEERPGIPKPEYRPDLGAPP